jgi:hypothetical protein
LLGGQTITKDQYDQILAAQPLPADQRTEILGVQGMVKMADGRIAVLIVGDDHSNPRPASTTLFIMAQNNGTWQIDNFVKSPESATPTP